ncbi:MAG: CPBP family intramembrane glutamic endopeptidase [Chloroflexota bacterium]
MIPSDKKQIIRNLIIFLLLITGLAWLGPLLGGDPTNPGPGLFVWGTAPLVSALMMRFIVRDKVNLGFRPAFKGNGVWYALSLLIYPLSFTFVLAVGVAVGASTLNNVSDANFLTAMVPIAVISFIFAFFEEVGWRGYLTPKIHHLKADLLGYALAGLIWASWHLPYMHILWSHTTEDMATLLPRFILGTIISFILYGEIRRRTGSVWPAVLMHGLGNTLASTLLAGYVDSPAFVSLTPGWEWLSSFGVEGVLMMTIFALIGGVLYRKKQSLNRISNAEFRLSET